MGTEVVPKSEEAVPAEAPSSLEQQIIRQIEYYFGNYNLSRDKFLREQLKLDDGWVPLETMVKFNRLKKLSDDFNVIVGALKKSPKQLMEVNEDSTKIRRRTAAPVPEDYSKRQEELEKRTIYVKGFKRTNTLDELLEFFKDFNVENIFMKKLNHQNNKPFKGSVFVTFETKDAAEKFIETKGIKYNGTELLKEWKADYVKRKDEYYSKLKAEKEKKIIKKEQEKAKEEEEGIKAAENDMVPGCLLKIVNLQEDTMREQVQEFFEPYGTIQYVDYSKGKPSAVLRFDKGQAKSVFEKVLKDSDSAIVKIGSSEATISVIEGDEEKEYWKNIAIFRAQRRKMYKNKHQGNKNFQNKKRKWGDRQRGKKNNDENDKDEESTEPPQKQKKVETSEENDAKESSSMEVSSAEQKKTEVEPQSES